MARNNVRLINYHTTGTTAPQIADMAVGEIAVGKDLIWSKHKENEELSVFISSGAVHSAITAAETTLKGITDGLSSSIAANTEKFNGYATTGALATAKAELTADYDGKFTAIKGEGYTSGTTLKSLSDAIDSLKGNSDTTVEAVASRVTIAEGKITTLETTVGNSTSGLVKDVADLKTKFDSYATSADTVAADTKTLNDAKSYTDSQINAIKGGETTATLLSLKSDIDNQGRAISGITNGTKLDSFKDVEDEINSKISSVYKVRGTKNTYADLPTEGNTIGDVYNVIAANGNTPAGTNYVCTASAGTREEQWDALGGTIDLSPYATTAITDGLKSRLDTAESNINTLTAATGTLNTSITTIQGWKINGSAITSDTVLNGTNLKVDTTAGAKTLNEAIAEAASSGSNANNAFTAWTAGTYTENQTTINDKLGKIDAYTVNGTKISEKPVLTGENVKVSTATTAQTLNAAIAEAKAAGTTASEAITALRDGYDGTIKSINDSVTANTSNISQLRTDVNGVSATTITAVQTITVTHTETNKITAEKTGTNVTFNFDNMVIDCGEF